MWKKVWEREKKRSDLFSLFLSNIETKQTLVSQLFFPFCVKEKSWEMLFHVWKQVGNKFESEKPVFFFLKSQSGWVLSEVKPQSSFSSSTLPFVSSATGSRRSSGGWSSVHSWKSSPSTRRATTCPTPASWSTWPGSDPKRATPRRPSEPPHGCRRRASLPTASHKTVTATHTMTDRLLIDCK